jgi:hypothetical protein
MKFRVNRVRMGGPNRHVKVDPESRILGTLFEMDPRAYALFGAIACVAGCVGSENSGPSGPSVPDTCTAANMFCPNYAYTLCVDVQNGPGKCIDWSRIGATPCPAGPDDCPTTLPNVSFPGGIGSTPIAICVSKDKEQYSGAPRGPDAGPLEPGFCAAFQAALVTADAGTCSPSPCGDGGHCSLVTAGNSGVIVECLWRL